MIPDRHEIDPRDIESLAQVIRTYIKQDQGATELAEHILEEWGLIHNYERLVRAALTLGPHPVSPYVGDVHEFNVALRPFQE